MTALFVPHERTVAYFSMEIALESRRLFTDLASFTDADLARAFGTYNVLRAKVHVDGPVQAEQSAPRGLVATLKTFLTNKRP